MCRSAKRLVPVVLAAGMWIGAAAAIWVNLARPALSRTSKLRQKSREHWVAPIAFVTLMVIICVTAAVLYWEPVLLRQGPATLHGTLSQSNSGPGPALMVRYGCAGCHVIPGVPGARGQVGPSLEGFGSRLYIGGAVANSSSDLVKWLIDPRMIDPRSAMPATGISEEEARIVAAYLLGKQASQP
jgi:cytochrome c1